MLVGLCIIGVGGLEYSGGGGGGGGGGGEGKV